MKCLPNSASLRAPLAPRCQPGAGMQTAASGATAARKPGPGSRRVSDSLAPSAGVSWEIKGGLGRWLCPGAGARAPGTRSSSGSRRLVSMLALPGRERSPSSPSGHCFAVDVSLVAQNSDKGD